MAIYTGKQVMEGNSLPGERIRQINFAINSAEVLKRAYRGEDVLRLRLDSPEDLRPAPDAPVPEISFSLYDSLAPGQIVRFYKDMGVTSPSNLKGKGLVGFIMGKSLIKGISPPNGTNGKPLSVS